MKKIPILICLAIVVVGGVLYGNLRKEAGEKQTLQQNLVKVIESKQSSKEVVAIDFNQITSFSWDKLYIFTPYTSEAVINKQLGFRWSKAGILKYSDSFDLIVFVKGEKVVQYVKLPRTNGQFIVDNKNEFAPDEKVEFKLD
ncbi:hypothetical protein [Paenibacillus gansuensis]|uniref:Lipoprotein n=1 Tax=Paenibacillus gansuensis TaxID=306542 RepID=A0ABW5P885_9BACL